MNNFKIYLIEDLEESALAVCEKLNAEAGTNGEKSSSFCYEWLKGTERKERNGKQFLFYTEGVLDIIEKHIHETEKNGEKIGLLLDVLLTEEDLNKSEASYYACASISRKIYNSYYNKLPVYIITSTAAFGGQSEIIMGKDLSEQFISTRNVIRYTSQEAMDKMLTFYEGFYAREAKGGA